MAGQANHSNFQSPPGKLPRWLRKRLAVSGKFSGTAHTLKALDVVTVCQEAKCPNLNECWNCGTATFMIMGDQCTRNCAFCAVHSSSQPGPLEASEPRRIAQAVRRLGLSYAVITSVTRDDLPDGGAEHFALTVQAIRTQNPDCRVEVLTSDFAGRKESVETVVSAVPTVFNHNVETVERLSAQIRSSADYRRSLQILDWAGQAEARLWTKSGLMVGLGETDQEIIQAMGDLRNVGCNILTIGQYLRPSPKHLAVDRYVTPETFTEYERIGRRMGFLTVAAGPFVRSSYQAAALLDSQTRNTKAREGVLSP